MDTNENTTTPPDRTSRRTMIKAGTAAGIVAVCLPSAADALSVSESGAFVATGGIAAPAEVNATASTTVNRAIDVTWPAVSGATSYQVKYRPITPPGQTYTVAGSDTGTSMTVTNLIAGTTYQFVVVAASSTEASFDSSPAQATAVRLAPGVPTSVAANSNNASVDVSWDEPTSGGEVSTYELRWSPTDGSGWTTITGISSTTFDYNVSGLTNGTTYYFQVLARNTTNASAWSASVSAVPAIPASEAVPPPPIPAPPVVGATTTSNSVTIFTDSDDGANGAPDWTYSFSTDGGTSWINAGLSTSLTSFTVTGITASSQTIRVRKVNGGTTATSTVTLTRKTPTYAPGQVFSIVNPNSTYGVRGITFSIRGGAGNKGGDDVNTGSSGGKGGVVAGSFTLNANETLYVAVGSGGSAGASRVTNGSGGAGGTNALTGFGGGRGGNSGRRGLSGSGGGGGAATVLRKGTTGSVTSATATTIAVAAGGGGGGGADSSTGSGGAYEGGLVSSGTSGSQGGTPPGGDDDGGGGGGGGGGDRGGLGGTSVYITGSGFFNNSAPYRYKGNGGSRGSNSVSGVTATTNATFSGSLVNGDNGTASLDYLEVSWASVPPV